MSGPFLLSRIRGFARDRTATARGVASLRGGLSDASGSIRIAVRATETLGRAERAGAANEGLTRGYGPAKIDLRSMRRRDRARLDGMLDGGLTPEQSPITIEIRSTVRFGRAGWGESIGSRRDREAGLTRRAELSKMQGCR